MEDIKSFIAKRVAKELVDGEVWSILESGCPPWLPTLFLNKQVFFQSENGFIGLGPMPEEGKVDPDIVNAGGSPVTIQKSGVFFDSSTSFGIIRGGHVSLTVLGALQVDEKGNIASYMIPARWCPAWAAPWTCSQAPKRSSLPWNTLPKARQSYFPCAPCH